MLDLTPYETGNALLRGRAIVAERVAEVPAALAEVCPTIALSVDDLREAARIAPEHDLTLYDAACAAVARRRGARLATLASKLLGVRLGQRPSKLAAEIGLR